MMEHINYYEPVSIIRSQPWLYYLPAKLHKRPWEWIWRKLIKWGLVNEIQNPALKEVQFKQFNLDTKDLMGACYRLLDQYEHTGRKARRIIMGRNYQREIMNQTFDYALTINVPTERYGFGRVELFGLEVEFNPFMDGIVVSGD